MEFKLVITASDELMEILRALTSFGFSKPKASNGAVKTLKTTTSETVMEKEENPPIAVTTSTTAQGTIPIETVRAAVQAKSKTKKDEIRKLLSEFSAESVSKLASEHFPEFLQKLEAL